MHSRGVPLSTATKLKTHGGSACCGWRSWRQYVYRAAARDRWHTARSEHAGDTLALDTLLLTVR